MKLTNSPLTDQLNLTKSLAPSTDKHYSLSLKITSALACLCFIWCLSVLWVHSFFFKLHIYSTILYLHYLSYKLFNVNMTNSKLLTNTVMTRGKEKSFRNCNYTCRYSLCLPVLTTTPAFPLEFQKAVHGIYM